MIHMSVDEADQLLKKSEFAKLGPFAFVETKQVANRNHKKYGSMAHYFTGQYHRHALYVFRHGEIVFLNEEDDDLLW